MRGISHVALAMLALTVTGRAKADAPVSLWEGCGANKVSGFSKIMVGPTAARSLTPGATADEGIRRCSEALRTIDATTPWQRKAALLRSRAKYYVIGQKSAEALIDLDTIASIERPDDAYRRSFAVSINMLRAVALLQTDQRDSAAKAALEAMRLRPWSQRIAQFAFIVCVMRERVPAGDSAQWDHLVMLDRDFIERRAIMRAQAGDWAGAATDWSRATPEPGEIGQTYVNVPNVSVQGLPGIPVKGVDVQRSVDAIVTAAMAGRSDLADSWLARVRSTIQVSVADDGIAKRFGITGDPSAQKAALEAREPTIAVAKLAGAGDIAGATKLLDTITTMPIDTVTIAMFRAIATKASGPSGLRLNALLTRVEDEARADKVERARRLASTDTLLADLPDHEDVMLANTYRSTAIFIRSNGSSVKLSKDGKTARISFFGNKSQPFAIGEMALLRAAELALEQQHDAFRITANDDYVQTSTMTMYGSPIGPSTVSGHSAVMSIEFVAAGTPGAVDAAKVRSELGPIYVKDTPKGP